MKKHTIFAAVVAAVLSLAASSMAQESAAPATTAEDASVTSLLSAPGPTFTVPTSALPKHWSLIAYGDTRFTDPANESVTNPFARRALVARIAELHPDAVVISGDLPYDGSNTNDYEVFHQETAAWRDQHLRIYPALGNHELHKDEVREPKNWWATFPELKGRRWYSVAFGEQYLIALDSDLPLTDGGRQQLWLADQLQHLPAKTRFVFFSLHHPPVADSIEGNDSHDVRPNEKASGRVPGKAGAHFPCAVHRYRWPHSQLSAFRTRRHYLSRLRWWGCEAASYRSHCC